ncbi:hypothetical protein A2960_03840 [Candidatus Gottesmanbacteria bacterium RIFCSPLOWO2_01_FULL_39_12b]|uniref:Uncharacterized protein n=1 Tax=Candidatus Gottesmanbacteria bacterium RIFCSPLOWO2_01_FULL_39_12b TaxID=1798388 RepID=A0A1F6AN40_9BACT|nr:MAG: hypothetical protein A2960_03840 [Candidatus Gottesmanbacteria bacterium RIFCSPLOWO2_01_FULL_39_12b]
MLTKKDLKDALKNLPTKNDLENTVGSLRGEFKREIKSVIENAATQILDAVSRGFEVLATKDDLKRVENKLESVESELKREINDLKADTPTPQEYRNHEKRISRLEKTVFSS